MFPYPQSMMMFQNYFLVQFATLHILYTKDQPIKFTCNSVSNYSMKSFQHVKPTRQCRGFVNIDNLGPLCQI